nr:MAG TPA: hypothetical protein [Bacteriophage sp.]
MLKHGAPFSGRGLFLSPRPTAFPCRFLIYIIYTVYIFTVYVYGIYI